jgi:hypothetical protein
MISARNISNFGFQPVTIRHQLNAAVGGVSVGDRSSPTGMEHGQPVTDRNRLDRSPQLVTDRYQFESVTNCNQLTFEVGHIRKYPQVAETYPQTTDATPPYGGSNASALEQMQQAMTPLGASALAVGLWRVKVWYNRSKERPEVEGLTPEGSQPLESPHAATTPEGSQPLFRVRDSSGKPTGLSSGRGLAANSPTARIWRRHAQTSITTNTLNHRTAIDHPPTPGPRRKHLII